MKESEQLITDCLAWQINPGFDAAVMYLVVEGCR